MKTTDFLPEEKPKIIQPTLKQMLHLEKWAFTNNLYVHPEYIKATKKKEKLLVAASFILMILSMITIKLIALIIKEIF